MFVVPFDEVRKFSKHQMPIKQEKNMQYDHHQKQVHKDDAKEFSVAEWPAYALNQVFSRTLGFDGNRKVVGNQTMK